MQRSLLFVTILAVSWAHTAAADDWPQWMGPVRDSVWRETGIVERFPDDGLPVKWRAEIGLGYAGPAVAGGRVFVADYVPTSGDVTNNPGGRKKLEGTERLLCLAADTGKLLWEHKYDRVYDLSYPGGPRCTPAVDGDRVYALGAEGDLWCLGAADGKVLWSKQLTKEYETETPFWGFAAHPLVDGDLLYCVVGGKGSVAVAFDKLTGKEVWRALDADQPGYCPPTMIEHAGTKQLLIWDPQKLNSLDPLTGKVHWSVPLEPSYGMSIAAPRKQGNYLFASGIGRVGALYELGETAGEPQVVWRGDPKTAVYSANSTPFLTGDMIYGADCHQGSLIGARLKDGERLWESFAPTTGGERRESHGTAYLVKHQDRFFLFSETGDLILAKLSPEGYEELGRFHVVEPTNEAFGRDVVWTHPAFARKCAFVRARSERQGDRLRRSCREITPASRGARR
jgi:outer membrane protein assembly factor BamB